MKLKKSETCQSLLKTKAKEESGNKWTVDLNVKLLQARSLD